MIVRKDFLVGLYSRMAREARVIVSHRRPEVV